MPAVWPRSRAVMITPKERRRMAGLGLTVDDLALPEEALLYRALDGAAPTPLTGALERHRAAVDRELAALAGELEKSGAPGAAALGEELRRQAARGFERISANLGARRRAAGGGHEEAACGAAQPVWRRWASRRSACCRRSTTCFRRGLVLWTACCANWTRRTGAYGRLSGYERRMRGGRAGRRRPIPTMSSWAAAGCCTNCRRRAGAWASWT